MINLELRRISDYYYLIDTVLEALFNLSLDSIQCKIVLTESNIRRFCSLECENILNYGIGSLYV